MQSLINTPVLAGISDYVAWWQWVLLILLIVLLVVYFKIRNKQM